MINYRVCFCVPLAVTARVLQVLLYGASLELNNYSVRSVHECLAQLQSGLGKPCVLLWWGSPYGGRKMHSGGNEI